MLLGAENKLGVISRAVPGARMTAAGSKEAIVEKSMYCEYAIKIIVVKEDGKQFRFS